MSAVPPLMAYDPAFAYEVGLVVKDGLRRMYGEKPEDVFYYLTLYNENYVQPPMAEGVEEGVIQGLYRWAPAPEGDFLHRATLAFSGTAQKAAREAREELAEHWGVGVELWSATSFKALREEAMSVERWNRLHPGEEPRVPLVTRLLEETTGPFVVVTDNMRAVPDQVSRWVPRSYLSLGTDGFGRSDTRTALRRFFETDKEHVVVGVLTALHREGGVGPDVVRDAINRYGLDPDASDPRRS
jgi:pyruvate dehydrogenase E1 component